MENDVLKNKIAPWQEKGRWYHAHITESGIDSLNTDKFLLDNMKIEAGSGFFSFPSTCVVVDYNFIVKSCTTNGTRYFQKQFNFKSDGSRHFNGINYASYTALDCDLYVYIIIIE